eukprot:CAMPEP_0185173310 /NCGR_PEP_ID=MMETSP1139-20130426/23198_1 /TAXON_ID=298111 /ORGANISM="Pavlova sp., Strain CCMP459" /LENGTH=74 /DNA_ID=CAMNT_0027738999 /DNA_START=233 /DNA_END=453 /DNA_ORIENTATION=-
MSATLSLDEVQAQAAGRGSGAAPTTRQRIVATATSMMTGSATGSAPSNNAAIPTPCTTSGPEATAALAAPAGFA